VDNFVKSEELQRVLHEILGLLPCLSCRELISPACLNLNLYIAGQVVEFSLPIMRGRQMAAVIGECKEK
jgi:hypothetical protein